MGGGRIGGIKLPSLEDIGKNVERTAGNALKGVAMMAQGDFNNAGRTIIDTTLAASGVGLMTNPDDVTALTGMETSLERKQTDVVKAQEAEALRQQQEAEMQRMTALNQAIDAMILQRVKTPGRSQTILGGASAKGGTLLTKA